MRLALLAVCTPALGSDTPARIEQLKAAYLFNFAKFVDWPGEPVRVVLCVRAGLSKSELVHALNGRAIDASRVLEVRDVVAPAADCHMYYSSGEYSQVGSSLQASLQAQADFPPSVLSISDRAGALERGYSFEFFVDDKKLRFAVNPGQLAEARYRVSSKLLNLARPRG